MRGGYDAMENERKRIDTEKIAHHIRGILEALNDDPNREGLQETPERVARMYAEVFDGMCYTNAEIAERFGKTFEHEGEPGDIVLVRDIEIFSYCEHHLALMYDMKAHVAYIPNGRVIGLSKVARIAETAARRLQLQERLGRDIAEIISMATGSDDVAVLLEGSHSCMTARGIGKSAARTVTTTYRGRFAAEEALKLQLERMV